MDDLDADPSSRRDQQARGDELLDHGVRGVAVAEHLAQLGPRSSTARVPSAVTRWRNASRTSALLLRGHPGERRLGVLRQRAADAADRVVRLARQLLEVAIAQLPQLRRGERQQRERARLVGDGLRPCAPARSAIVEARSRRGAPARRRCAADPRRAGRGQQLQALRRAGRAAPASLAARTRKSSRSVSTTRTGRRPSARRPRAPRRTAARSAGSWHSVNSSSS